MPYIKVLGFAPDVEPHAPGIVQSGRNIVPTTNGMAGSPTGVNTDLPNLSATAVDAITLHQIDGTVRTFAGTPTELYEAGSKTWTKRTRASGSYTAGTTWRFAQLGVDSFATNDTATIQKSTTGDFADISAAPVCSIIEGVRDQLLAFDTNDATFGDQPDRWWACANGNVESWAPSIATGAVSGRLVDTPGGIKAAHRLFDQIVVYKERSIYLGQYVGAPEGWRFSLLSDEIGAVAQEAVVPLESFHVFCGVDDFYIFDGARPRSIGGDIREFFFNSELCPNNRNKMRAAYSRELSRIAFAYCSIESSGGGDGGTLDSIIYYHVRTNRFGAPQRLSTRALFEYVRPTGPTYDDLGDFFATYDEMPTIPYDSTFWSTKVNKLAIFDESDKLKTLDGEPATAEMTFWNMGRDGQYSFLRRTRPRFGLTPTSGKQINAYADDAGGTFTNDTPTATLSDGKFDCERSARWHRLTYKFEGNVELLGIEPELVEDGIE